MPTTVRFSDEFWTHSRSGRLRTTFKRLPPLRGPQAPDSTHKFGGRGRKTQELPTIDPAFWHKDWGVDLKPFGSGENVIKYLGRYVCRTAIGDSRILSITDTHVSFSWKDRANGNAPKIETLTGIEFVKRYLRHVLPRGMRAIRYFGFCHPAAKVKRERIAFHNGRPLLIGALEKPPEKTSSPNICPCCGGGMRIIASLLPLWRSIRGPPHAKKQSP